MHSALRKGMNCSIRPFISTHNFQPKCPQRQLKLSPTRTSHSPCSPQFLLSNSEIHLSWMSPVTHCYLNEQLSSLQCQHLHARASQAALVVKKKKPACQCRRPTRRGFGAWVRTISWRRNWQPTPEFFLENPMDRGLRSMGPQRVRHE